MVTVERAPAHLMWVDPGDIRAQDPAEGIGEDSR